MRTEQNEYYTVIYADEGKLFAHRNTGDVLSGEIYLGKNDSPDNYVEIDAPEESADE